MSQHISEFAADAVEALGSERYASVVAGPRPVIWRRRLEGATLAQIAGELGISIERVRQIEALIWRDLRRAVERTDRPITKDERQGNAAAGRVDAALAPRKEQALQAVVEDAEELGLYDEARPAPRGTCAGCRWWERSGRHGYCGNNESSAHNCHTTRDWFCANHQPADATDGS